MQENLQDCGEESHLGGIPGGQETRTTLTLHLQYWEENLVAAYAEDERMQAVLEKGDHFYKRVIGICLRKPLQCVTEKEGELGALLVRAGNYGRGEGWLANGCGLQPQKARKLLEQYYAVFYRTREWVERQGDAAYHVVQSRIESLNAESLARCVAHLPTEWRHEYALTFTLPSYIYSVQAEKFFRHYFECEERINSAMVHLAIRTGATPEGKNDLLEC